MPVVFAAGAPTASGHEYEDIFAVQYEFPHDYRGLVDEGDRFLYYRGRRAPGSGGKAVYVGNGVVGEVRQSRNPGNLVATLSEVTTFAVPVSLKLADGTYRETGTQAMTNFANGVRRVSDAVFDGIHAAGMSGAGGRAGAYADPIHAARLERYSVAVVLALLRQEFGQAAVREMPAGNPGFDIEVLCDRPIHVEVKGTVLSDPVFHISEGQRKHAELLGNRFRLVVVYDVDLHRETHQIGQTTGPLSADRAILQPEAYAGFLVG